MMKLPGGPRISCFMRVDPARQDVCQLVSGFALRGTNRDHRGVDLEQYASPCASRHDVCPETDPASQVNASAGLARAG